MNETEHLYVPKHLLQKMLDMGVKSLDFGSNFWDQEDVDAAREVAVLLGVCPNGATPDLGTVGKPKYPICVGLELWVLMKREEYANHRSITGSRISEETIQWMQLHHLAHEVDSNGTA